MQRYGRVVREEESRPELERVLAVARRVLPLARSASSGVRTLALVSLAAGAVIVGVVLSRDLPDAAGEVVRTILLAVLVGAPGAVLLVFHFALEELIELPRRLRDLPREGREHASELARLQREAGPGPDVRDARLLLALWRLVSFLRGNAWLLRPYAPIAAVLSPLMLVAVALSVVATIVLVLIAVVLLLTALA